MAKVLKSALVPYSAKQMYQLVDNVRAYHAFLPWCGASEEISRDDNIVLASVTIKKGAVDKTFTTRNTNHEFTKIEMELVDGPFKALHGSWTFNELKESACKVSLDLEYEFSSKLLGMVVGPVFNQVANTMVDSFVRQAKEVYD